MSCRGFYAQEEEEKVKEKRQKKIWEEEFSEKTEMKWQARPTVASPFTAGGPPI
jgi:hypothetical protein